ncbi:MAG: polysulfide reductase NrfD, partial [Bacteroidetes bacterium]|nr:polysulfide reductase NrfD [Bacteroidota bacterium]
RVIKNPKNEKFRRNARILAIILFPLAMGIVLVPDGALFSFVKAREFWNRPLLLPHFANAALVSAVAVMVVIAYISEKIEKVELLNLSAKVLIGYMLIFLVAGVLFLDLFDILVLRYSEKPEGIEAWKALTNEHLVFFLVNILGLVFAGILLLIKKGRKFPNLFYSAILIILAISAYRYNLIIIGQEIPLFKGQNVELYFPTLIEIYICAGVTSFMTLSYHILIGKLKIKSIIKNNI